MQPAAASPVLLVPRPKRIRMAGEDRRRLLLRAAIDCFARRGFSGTKTKDIAAAAGVSEAILFRHFATKDDLYHAILDLKTDPARTREMKRQLEDCASRRDDAGLIRAVVHEIFHSFKEDPAFHRLILYSFLEGHLMAKLFHQRFGAMRRDFIQQYFALRQKEGSFRKCDPALAVSSMVGLAVHLAMAWNLFGLKRPSITEDKIVEELVAFAMGGLQKKGSYGK
jgi:TetR/AcrR family transcriptional regulator